MTPTPKRARRRDVAGADEAIKTAYDERGKHSGSFPHSEASA